MWRDFRLPMSAINISNGNIKCPIGKSVFAANLPLKLFRASVANTDIESLKSLQTSLLECLYHMLVKFVPNCMVQTTRNFELFDKKAFFKIIFNKALNAILKNVSEDEIIV